MPRQTIERKERRPSLAGDDGGDYRAWTPAAGTHTLTATAYTGPNATGAASLPLVVRFTVR
jgi:hypothetical protein